MSRQLIIQVERDTVSFTLSGTSYPTNGEAFEIIYGSKGRLLGYQMNCFLPLDDKDVPGYDMDERYDLEGTELQDLPIEELAMIVYDIYQDNIEEILGCATRCSEQEYSMATEIMLRALRQFNRTPDENGIPYVSREIRDRRD